MTPSSPGHLYEIDHRHRDWLRHILKSGYFRRVLEVGSYKGFSTVAFLDALDAGAVGEVHLCDPYPRIELRWLIAKREGVHLHECPSTDLLDRDGDFDLLFVDGDHGEENCRRELTYFAEMNPTCFVAHDTGSAGRYPDCEGPGLFKRHFQGRGWYTIEDTLYRPGERTERGLFVATPDRAVYEAVLEGYRTYC